MQTSSDQPMGSGVHPRAKRCPGTKLPTQRATRWQGRFWIARGWLHSALLARGIYSWHWVVQTCSIPLRKSAAAWEALICTRTTGLPDSNWAGRSVTRKSTSCTHLMLGVHPIWSGSSTQTSISLSRTPRHVRAWRADAEPAKYAIYTALRYGCNRSCRDEDLPSSKSPARP